MLRKKAPRLAAAFVVTISAGCGGATTAPPDPNRPFTEVTGPNNLDGVSNLGSMKEGFVRGADGKCFIQHGANPPWMEPADCETQRPLTRSDSVITKPTDIPTFDKKPEDPTPPETPATLDDSNVDLAPTGWRIQKDTRGACRAFAPPQPCPKGARCNPPPPRTVKCPKDLPKDEEDPMAL